MAWKGKVSAYLVTKGVSAGALIAGAIAVATGHGENRPFVGIALPVIALVFAAVTGALLIADLKQPRRCLFIFTKPQWRSWLVRGAFVLAGYGALASVWLLGGLIGSRTLVEVVATPTALLSVGTAGYTAFLFGQCEGRDFWQTSLLLPTLLAQAGACGSAVALLAAPVFDVSDFLHRALTWLLLGSVAATAGLVAVELTTKGTVHVETAKWTMTHGTYRTRFWGSIIIGLAFAGALAGSALLLDQRFLASVAGVAALVGVALYEDAFVRAGQSVPLC